jgi:CPA2 family monovalent cation:H+ antiporter-2
MGHDILLLFAAGMASALLLGYLALRLGLSPIVGYLLAGIIVGPHTPGFVGSASVAEQFAEIGIILLMFGVGLKFHLHELVAVWRISLPGAIFQSTVSTLLAYGLLRWLGWEAGAALVSGLALSVASTVVLVRVLGENRDLSSRLGHIAIGWVVVEDLITILLLVALPVLAGPAKAVDAGWPLLAATGKVALCAAFAFYVGGKVIPWALGKINDTRSRELFMLGVLTAALGLAVLAAKLFGVSMALGAFLAGLVVARSDYSARAAAEALPMRDAFAVLFFVSVGMLFDPQALWANPWPSLVLLGVVIVVKPLAAAWVMRLAGEPRGQGLRLGAALGQVGEFTFVLGTAARSLGLLDQAAWNALVAVAMASIALNPWLYRVSRRHDRSLKEASAPPEPTLPAGHIVLVGFGEIGKKVHAELRGQGKKLLVIDAHLPTIRRLQKDKVPAICGDANLAEVLEQGNLDQAAGLIVCCELTDAAKLLGGMAQRYPNLKIAVRIGNVNAFTAEPKGVTIVREDNLTANGLSAAVLEPPPTKGQLGHM